MNGAVRRDERPRRFPSSRPLLAAMSARRRVDVFVYGHTGWVRHPARLRGAQHLGAPCYQRVDRLEEARAVGAQLLRDKVAWKIRRPRAGRCLRLFVRSGNNLPTCLWKPWISRNLLTADASAASGLEAATSGATLRGRAWAETPRKGGVPHEMGAKSANLSTATGAIRVSASAWVLVSQEGRQLAGPDGETSAAALPVLPAPEAQATPRARLVALSAMARSVLGASSSLPRAARHDAAIAASLMVTSSLSSR